MMWLNLRYLIHVAIRDGFLHLPGLNAKYRLRTSGRFRVLGVYLRVLGYYNAADDLHPIRSCQ